MVHMWVRVDKELVYVMESLMRSCGFGENYDRIV